MVVADARIVPDKKIAPTVNLVKLLPGILSIQYVKLLPRGRYFNSISTSTTQHRRGLALTTPDGRGRKKQRSVSCRAFFPTSTTSVLSPFFARR